MACRPATAGRVRTRLREPGNEGKVIEFRLPYVAFDEPQATQADAERPVPATGDRNESQAEAPMSGMSVLVAEDEVINRVVLETLLVESGARVVGVGNGALAVERVRVDGGDAYSLVLLDVQMPEMDGHEAARRIRALAPTTPSPPAWRVRRAAGAHPWRVAQ